MIRRLLIVLLLLCGAYTVVAVAQSGSSRERTRELENAATEALFSRSNLPEAERFAGQALAADPASIPAHFVLMEAAALEGDEGKLLDAALAICDADPAAPATIRVSRRKGSRPLHLHRRPSAHACPGCNSWPHPATFRRFALHW